MTARRLAAVVAALTLLAFAAPALAHQAQMGSTTELTDKNQAAGSARNMKLIGHADLGMRGYNADVWVHEQYAYVGAGASATGRRAARSASARSRRSRASRSSTRATRRNPRQVAKLQQPAATSIEDVVVYTAKYGKLAGRDIAVGGIQVCGVSRYDTGVFRGLIAWDVTTPSRPVELGRIDTGAARAGCTSSRSSTAPTSGGRSSTLRPASEYDDAASPTGRRDVKGRGDFRLIDVTDPAAPVETANWGVRRNGGPGLPAAGHRQRPRPDLRPQRRALRRRQARVRRLWDSGFIDLDVTDPRSRSTAGARRTRRPPTATATRRSSTRRATCCSPPTRTSQDVDVEDREGLRLPARWRPAAAGGWSQVGTFKTANATGTNDTKAGDYTIHNPLLDGTDLYVSWYTDGIRVLDSRNPAAIVEVASFVPPAFNNPVQPSQRGTLTNAQQVWGVAYDKARDLVFGSDMNSGLWIVKRTDR